MSDYIKLSDTNAEIQHYLQYHNELKELLKSGTPLSADANNYFTSDHISFTFDKEQINYLFEQNPDANCLRFYFGSRTDGNAKPTLIAIACDQDRDKINNLFVSDEFTGVEFPAPFNNLQNQDPASFDVTVDNS